MASQINARRSGKRSGWLSWRFRVLILFFLFCAWFIGLVLFSQRIVSSAPDVGSTDGLVVLTGGSQRIEVAGSLLRQMPTGRMLVTGVDRSVDRPTLLSRLGALSEAEKARVDLGYAAEDTVGNALESAGWAVANGYRSLRIVTAAYHMPRSLAEFHHVMPDIEILSHPVFPERVAFDNWWRSPGTATLMATEWTKYIFASLRIAATDWLQQQGEGAS